MTIRQDIELYQGGTWSFAFVYRDAQGDAVDVSGYSARMAIKAGFQSSYEAYLSSGSDADGGTIALAADGTVTISMTASQSAKMAGDLTFFIFFEPAERVERIVRFMYDIELVSPAGVVDRALEGHFLVQREVTS